MLKIDPFDPLETQEGDMSALADDDEVVLEWGTALTWLRRTLHRLCIHSAPPHLARGDYSVSVVPSEGDPAGRVVLSCASVKAAYQMNDHLVNLEIPHAASVVLSMDEHKRLLTCLRARFSGADDWGLKGALQCGAWDLYQEVIPHSDPSVETLVRFGRYVELHGLRGFPQWTGSFTPELGVFAFWPLLPRQEDEEGA